MRNRVCELHVGQVKACLEHLNDQQHRANLQCKGGLGHVGIADDDVHATETVRIPMRFVAGVDDRAGARRRRGHTLPYLVGALRDDECVACDLAGAADELACD